MFNYGNPVENIKHYGIEEPPLIPFENLKYNLKDIELLIVTGDIDEFTPKEEIERLKGLLPDHT